MVKKILIVLVLLPLLILLFAPKKELYSMFQKQLAKQGIEISGGDISSTPVGLNIKHPSLYFKGIKIADIDNISLQTFWLYTNVGISGLKTDESMRSYLPPRIDSISLTHSVVNPKNIILKVSGKDTHGAGTISVLKPRKLHLHFDKLPTDSPIKRYLKSNKGGFDYEQNL